MCVYVEGTRGRVKVEFERLITTLCMVHEWNLVSCMYISICEILQKQYIKSSGAPSVKFSREALHIM